MRVSGGGGLGLSVDDVIWQAGGMYDELTDEYLHDESRMVGAADVLVRARCEEELVAALREASARGWAVTTQGGSTGITGGGVPQGGLVLSTKEMTRILDLHYDDEGRCYVRAEPGVTLAGLRGWLQEPATISIDGVVTAECERYRAEGQVWMFPPDLTESGACLGGVCATNGSGARSFRYGAVRGHVQAVRMVLADGDVLALRRGEVFADGRHFELTSESGRVIAGELPSYVMPDCKHSAGYFAADGMDMLDLLIGSEGTLGVFSEVEVRLTRRPACAWGMTAFLSSKEQALSYVEALRGRRLPAEAIEYFSGEALGLLQVRSEAGLIDHLPALPALGAAVYVEFAGDRRDDVEMNMSEAAELLEAAGGNSEQTWLSEGYEAIERFKGIRHCVPEAINALIAERRQQYPSITKLGTDLAVPDSGLRAVMGMYDDDLQAAGLEYVIFGHIGDNHLHVNILPRDPDGYERGKALYMKWAGAVVEMGGTISAEHGVGKLKTGMLELMYGSEGVAAMRAVKRGFDPDGRLNRGTLFAVIEV